MWAIDWHMSRGDCSRIAEVCPSAPVCAHVELFWHRVWKDAGSPPTGALATIMRNTRAKYHRAVELHKRDSDRFRGSLIPTSIVDGNNRDLCKEAWHLEDKCPIQCE